MPVNNGPLRRSSAWLCSAVLLATLQPAHGAQRPSGEAAAVPVVTTTVAQEDVATRLLGIGTVQAAQSVTVKVRVDGQLEKVAFTEGQDVRQGDLLAQIDPRPLQALLNQALAQKARDDAALTAALKDIERYATLVSQGLIPRQTMDAQQATVDGLKATVQADQAQIDNARVQLGFTSIRAPVSGRAGMRLVDAGNIVRAADPTGLVVINQIDPIAVVFTLPESDFQTVNQAIQKSGSAKLQVTALARQDNAILGVGHLLLVNNLIDTSTGTIQLKALFANGAHKLWPGQYVNARLETGVRHHALTVPEAAVQRGPGGLFVYVVGADSLVSMRPIHTTLTQDGKAVIDTGLAPGERVVVDGQFRIRPGVKAAEVKRAPARP